MWQYLEDLPRVFLLAHSSFAVQGLLPPSNRITRAAESKGDSRPGPKLDLLQSVVPWRKGRKLKLKTIYAGWEELREIKVVLSRRSSPGTTARKIRFV